MRYAIKAVDSCGKGCPNFIEQDYGDFKGFCEDPLQANNGKPRRILHHDGPYPHWCELEEGYNAELETSIRGRLDCATG